MGWLDYIKQKPRGVRDQYALFGAGICAGLVALLWFISVPAQFLVSVSDGPTADRARQTDGSSTLFGNIADLSRSLSAQVSGMFNDVEYADESTDQLDIAGAIDTAVRQPAPDATAPSLAPAPSLIDRAAVATNTAPAASTTVPTDTEQVPTTTPTATPPTQRPAAIQLVPVSSAGTTTP